MGTLNAEELRKNRDLSRFQLSLLGSKLMSFAEEKIKRENIPVKISHPSHVIGKDGRYDTTQCYYIESIQQNVFKGNIIICWTVGRKLKRFYHFFELFHCGEYKCDEWKPGFDFNKAEEELKAVIAETLDDKNEWGLYEHQ